MPIVCLIDLVLIPRLFAFNRKAVPSKVSTCADIPIPIVMVLTRETRMMVVTKSGLELRFMHEFALDLTLD